MSFPLSFNTFFVFIIFFRNIYICINLFCDIMKKYIIDLFTNVGLLHIIASIVLIVLVNVFIFPPNETADIIANVVSGLGGATIGVHLNRIITKKYLTP